jgi:cytochrome c peroxidase
MRYQSWWVGMGLVLSVVGGTLAAPSVRGQLPGGPQGSIFTMKNESGVARTINVAGFPVVATDNPFFLDLGVNGRRCVTCHQPENNMTVTPAGLQERFETTRGKDPIFRSNDGSNSPLADVSTVAARRAASSMLLTKALIRVGLPIPANAEFDLIAVNDPYGFASSQELSLFRRPLPSTNLAFLSTVMWDGRETLQKGSPAAIHFDFDNQANDATQGHAQRPNPIDQATREQIFAYEIGLYTAQILDRAAGELHADGGKRPPWVRPDGCDLRSPEGAVQPDRLHRVRRLGEARGPWTERGPSRGRPRPGPVQHALHPDCWRGGNQ